MRPVNALPGLSELMVSELGEAIRALTGEVVCEEEEVGNMDCGRLLLLFSVFNPDGEARLDVW